MRRLGLHLFIGLWLILTTVQLQAGRTFETEVSEIHNKQRIKFDLGIDYSHIASRQDLMVLPLRGGTGRGGLSTLTKRQVFNTKTKKNNL